METAVSFHKSATVGKYLAIDAGLDNSVGIATFYSLDGPGIEYQWGEDFPHSSRPAWAPTSLLYNGYRLFPGVKRPRRGVDHPPTSSVEIKERVQLYIYSPSWPSWPVLG